LNGTWRHRVAHLPTGEVVAGELFWYAPLAAAVSMGAIAAVLLLVQRAARSSALTVVVPGACFALGTYSLARASSIGIGGLAAVVLSVGVGTVVTRMFMRQSDSVWRFIRGSYPFVLAALVAWAVGLPQLRAAAERRALAGLPAPTTNGPNVLVIIWDTVRAMSTSTFGYARPTTPELTRLAARGAAFDRAFATSSWSLPSHGSLFTGRYPHEMSVGFDVPLDDTHPTLGEVLSSRGYTTAGFTANLFYGSRDYGIARGFTRYDERPALNWLVVTHTWWLSRRAVQRVRFARGDYRQALRRHAEDVNRAFLNWLDRQEDRPFYAVINHFDAHEPYRPPDPFHRTFASPSARYWGADDSDDLTPEVFTQLRDSYDGSIRYLDHTLGNLLSTMNARGRLNNTIVVVTSDHGEEFGEHGAELRGHAKSLYLSAVQVPLVIFGPGVPEGVRLRETVSIRDIPATIMELTSGTTDPFPGTSLVRLARRELAPGDSTAPRLQVGAKHRWAAQNPEWPTSAGDIFSLVRGDHHYIVNADGREELYDVLRDTTEQRNLASTPAMEPLLRGFRYTLDSLVPASGGVRSARLRSKPGG
ncbi:MAG TPA: sulfatase, partial [Gemmatimonadaceae bacterium]